MSAILAGVSVVGGFGVGYANNGIQAVAMIMLSLDPLRVLAVSTAGAGRSWRSRSDCGSRCRRRRQLVRDWEADLVS